MFKCKYQFIPDIFSEHLIFSPISRCLQTLKEEFQRDLSKKYGFAALKYMAVGNR